MTKREFLNAVIIAVDNAELKAFAESEIQKMDARNAKRSATPSKKSLANEPIKEKISEYLAQFETPQVASDIAKAVEVSTQKSSALCRQMVDGGLLKVEDVKVKGKGKVKGYSLA